MSMEESVQHVVMMAIQEVRPNPLSPNIKIQILVTDLHMFYFSAVSWMNLLKLIKQFPFGDPFIHQFIHSHMSLYRKPLSQLGHLASLELTQT